MVFARSGTPLERTCSTDFGLEILVSLLQNGEKLEGRLAMIPNAMTSTGPYAGLWSHLRSIDYTLERVMCTSPHKLTELEGTLGTPFAFSHSQDAVSTATAR